MTTDTPSRQPPEYTIDSEYIEKLDEWLGEHGIDELQRMQIRTRLKLNPVEETHCDKCDHWDICEGCPYTDERATHTSPPAPHPPCEECIYQAKAAKAPAQGMTADELWDYSNDLAEAAAKDARDDLWKRLEKACVEYHNAPVVHFSSVEDIFESLRGTAGAAMTTAQEDSLTVLNTAMLAILVIMNLAWHYGWA